MNQNMLGAALTFLTGRSTRLRKYAPLIPLLLGAYAFFKQQRDAKVASAAAAH